MTWVVVILLVLSGWRQPDVRYDRACVRLDHVSRGMLTCDELEDRFLGEDDEAEAEAEAEPAADGTAEDTGSVGISNGF